MKCEPLGMAQTRQFRRYSNTLKFREYFYLVLIKSYVGYAGL